MLMHPDERYIIIRQTDGHGRTNIIQNLDALHNRPLRGKNDQKTYVLKSSLLVTIMLSAASRVHRCQILGGMLCWRIPNGFEADFFAGRIVASGVLKTF